MSEFSFKKTEVFYTVKPIVWLEPKPGLINLIGRKAIKLLSYFIKLFPFKGRFLSPYIIIKAAK